MKWMPALALLAVALLAACGSDDEPVASDDGPAAPAGSIDGDYRSVEVTENGQPRPLFDDTVIQLRLEEGQLSASAGCNSLGGSFTVAEDVLVVRDGLSMTEMGCAPELMEQDTWLADFLTAGPTVDETDDGLTLATDTTTIRFVDREIVEPDAELVGTTWTVTGFIDGDTAMSTSSTTRGQAELRFEDDGFVTGHDGCNSLGYADDGNQRDGLTYEVSGDEITFQGNPVQTLIGCDDPNVDRFHAVLSGTVTWEIEASSLTLLAEDGRGVTYTAS